MSILCADSDHNALRRNSIRREPPLSSCRQSSHWPPSQSGTTVVERRRNRRPSMANPTRPSVIVQARLSRAILTPAHGSTFLTNVVEMALSTAHPRAAPAMRDQGIFGGSHDDSHAGAASFQWANKIDAPVTHTKASTNV